jgi:hypothetical protein
MQAQSVDLEFILPVCNQEDGVTPALRNVVSCLRELAVPAAIAVVDCGSSDRTLERVDGVAADSPVPIRTVGCSRPGWATAALRGIATTPARWVIFGETGVLGAGMAGALDHAVRMLAAGRHVVCAAVPDGRATLLDAASAAVVVGGQSPAGPWFAPDLPDTVGHAGLRMAAVGRAAAPIRVDVDATAVLERVGV